MFYNVGPWRLALSQKFLLCVKGLKSKPQAYILFFRSRGVKRKLGGDPYVEKVDDSESDSDSDDE